MISKYFKPEEFQRCTPSCSIAQMDDRLLLRLDIAREFYGRAMLISSAYRSKEYELSKDRPGTSSHCKGLAVDIKCSASNRLELLGALLRAGFVRIGIASSYIHVDVDSDKPPFVWLY